MFLRLLEDVQMLVILSSGRNAFCLKVPLCMCACLLGEADIGMLLFPLYLLSVCTNQMRSFHLS